MKKLLVFALLLPLFLIAQQPKPKTTVKPKTTQTKAKPTATKTATTTPKPKTAVTPVPKKENPAVTKLVEKAYVFYKDNKDKECEATVKQILALDPKNKDAFMLRANMAMFAGDNAAIWKNLDLIYKYHPKEPEIYSQFAVNHLTYNFFSDSMKRVLCRKTIMLGTGYAEGYASLGLVAAVGGNYEEAVNYFNISFRKIWKDTNSRTILHLPYARCQYELGMKEEAINTISTLIPRLKGEDKYTCIYMRATYKMELGQNDVKADVDSLRAIYPNDIGVKKLYLTYLKKSGSADSSLCAMAREIRQQSEDNFDISDYCKDLQKTIAVKNGSRLTYDIKGSSYIIEPTAFDYNKELKFNWYRGSDEYAWDTGKVTISRSALDSAVVHESYFNKGSDEVLNESTSLWMSHLQFNNIRKDSVTRFSIGPLNVREFRYAGHEQIEILNVKNESVMVDCIRISDGEEVITYLNDSANPLIIKMSLRTFSMVLSKFE